MRKFVLLVFVLLTSFTGFSQDFSNKGKDFYLCFPQHVPSGANAKLSVWITSDKASSGTITMASGAFSSTFNIAANGLAEINIPYAFAHISNGESTTEFFTQILKKSIRVKVDPGKPAVVAYVQQYGNARSAASLLLPVNVLGKKYFAISFTQTGASSGSNIAKSQFQVIAVKDNTVITITLMKNGVKGIPFTITLPLAGDMIQYQSNDATALTQDLTGTLIESVASGNGGCLPIAVFSGSSNLKIGTQSPLCGASANSYDPLFQQLYPVNTWGQNFGFIPFANHPAGVPFRVMAAEDNTNVFFNGVLVATLNTGQIYPTAFTLNGPTLTTPTSITANKPICVAEYAQCSSCTGVGGGSTQGDPDMVILNPIEQNISDITIFSTKQEVIRTQWINVLMKTTGTASFRISRNGCALSLPAGTWQPFAALPGYSYLKEPLTLPGTGTCTTPGTQSDSYRLVADSGFNAIAYGLGDNETYAYSAGTYVKDQNAPGASTTYGVDNNKVCIGLDFKIKIPLPYIADSIYWDVSSLPGYTNTWTYYPPGTPDSTTGTVFRPIYWYSLPTNFVVNVPNTYIIRATTYSQNTDGCGNEQDVEFEIEVTGPPTANYTWTTPNCFAEPVQFNDASASANPIYKWWWDFGDPASGAANNAFTANPTHLFTAPSIPGTYDVRYVNITTPGCLSDTIHHLVEVAPLPSATINGTNTVCINGAPQNIVFTGSGAAPGGEYTFYYHINSGGQLNVNSAGGIATIQHNPTVTGTFIYTLDSVRIIGSTLCVSPLITGQQVTVTVTPDATIAIRAGDNASQTLCINNLMTPIRYDIAGSGTGGTVAFVPALPGVTGTYAGGVVTIQGTPTLSGTFSYTVTPTGPCPYAGVPPGGTITVNDDATITLQSTGTDNQTKCVNTAITNIDYLVSGGATGATIAWVPTTPTGITFTPIGGGIYRISGASSVTGTFNYTINTQGPCIKPSLGGTLTVNPDATIAIRAGDNASQTLCINNLMTPIRYDIAGSGTGGTVAFVPALPGVTGTYAGGVVTIQGTPTLSGTFSYTVTPTGPCPYAGVPPGGTLTVNDDATIILQSTGTDNQTKCVNTAITNIDYLVAGGATGATIAWVPTTPTGISFTPIGGGVYQIAGASSVTGTFNYTINTQGPCVKPSLNGTLTINPAPSASITGTTEVCQNNPVWPGITFTGSGGTVPYTFTYTIDAGSGPGLPQTITTTGLNTSIQVQQPTAVAGTFTYKLLSVQDGSTSACSQAMSIPDQVIKVNELPNGTISGSNLICINSTPRPDITFTASGGTVPYTFTYQVLPAGPLQTISTTGSNTSVTLQVPNNIAGTFTYRLISISDGSTTACVQNVTAADVVIGVSDVFPAPDFAFTDPVCIPNAVVQFQNLSNIANGTPLTYLWNFGDGSPTQMSVNPSHQYGNVGPFNVSLRATSNAGCITDKVVAINNIHPQPKANFSFNKPGVCIGDDVTLTDLSDGKDGTINQWHWNMGDGGIKTTSTVTYTYTDTITYNIKLYTINTYNCNSDTITKQFTVYPYPHVNAGPDRSILEGGQITLSPVVYGNDLQFLWTPNQYLIDNRIEKVKVNKPLTDMTYRLTVTARGGCSLSDDVFVKLLKFPIIPNTFTPNNDGINDTWRIDYLNTYPNNVVQVFTRTGQLVFESRGYNTPWDGTIKGKPLPFDTYYYIIEPGNGREPLTGYVTILK